MTVISFCVRLFRENFVLHIRFRSEPARLNCHFFCIVLKKGDGIHVDVRRVVIEFHPSHFGISFTRLLELTGCG